MSICHLLEQVDVDRPSSWRNAAQNFAPTLRDTIRATDPRAARTTILEAYRLVEQLQESILSCCRADVPNDPEAAERVLRHAYALLETAQAALLLRDFGATVSELPTREFIGALRRAVESLGGSTGENFSFGFLAEDPAADEKKKLLTRLEHVGQQTRRYGWATAGSIYWIRYWISGMLGWPVNPLPDPRSPKEFVLAPVAGFDSKFRKEGDVGELRLEVIDEAGALVCHPATALQVCDSKWLLPTLEQGLRDRDGQDGVCWSLHWSDGHLRSSQGESLDAAIRAAFRLLDSADYDPNCLLMATVVDDGSEKLGSVTHEKEKIEAALRRRTKRDSKLRVGLPPTEHDDRHNPLRLTEHEKAALQGVKNIEFEELTTLADAVRFASERQVGVRRYLEDLRDRPDLRKQPLYLEGKTPSKLYIEPDVVETTDDREDPQAQQERDRGSSRPQYEPDFGMLYGERPHEHDKRAPWKSYVERLQSGNLRAAILHGAPGTGKSHLLEMLASDLAGKLVPAQKPVQLQLDALEPVALLSANRLATAYRDYIAETTSGASSFVAAALTKKSRQDEGAELTEAVARYLEERLRYGGGWLLIDAIDEVQQINKAALSSLFEELQKWKCRIVITSRKYAWTEDLQHLFEEKPLEMASFTPEQRSDYVERWFGDNSVRGRTTLEAIQSNPAVAAIAQNPYLATLLCWVSSLGTDLESITKTRLYEVVLRRLVGTTKDRYDDRQAKQLLRSLATVACDAFAIHLAVEPLGEEDLLDSIGDATLEDLHKKRLLLLVATQSEDGLTEVDGYHFAHRSMLEYLVARSWARKLSRPTQTGKEWREADERFWNPDWQEVVIFTAGCLADPERRADEGQAATRLLDLLSDEATDDLCRSRLALAGRCLPEVAGRREHREQVEKIAKAGLECWEEYLREGSKALNLLLNESLAPMAQAMEVAGLGVQFVTQPLLALLEDPDGGVRGTAAYVLGRLGEKAATDEVLRSLLALFEGPHMGVRRTATDALVRLGKKAKTYEVLPSLLALLEHPDFSVGQAAAYALGRIGEAAATDEVLGGLLALLEHPDGFVRQAAAEALGGLGEKAATDEVLRSLLALLEDPDGNVREVAADALGGLGEKQSNDEVLRGLLALLEHPDGFVRWAAVGVLGRLGEKAATNEVLRSLLALLEHPNGFVRQAAADALGGLGEKASIDEILHSLLALLEDPDGRVRWAAANALGGLGEKAATDETLRDLLARLQDPDVDDRQAPARALGRLGEKAATDEVLCSLLALLEHPDASFWAAAAEALRRLGEKAATNELLDDLRALLDLPDADVRRAAAYALKGLVEKAAIAEVVRALLVLLDHPEAGVRLRAADALGRLGEKAAIDEVLRGLLALLEDPAANVSWAAGDALGRLGEKAATDEVLRGLLALLDHLDGRVRVAAVRVLGSLGEKAATDEGLRVLLALLRDPVAGGQRAAAASALGSLGENAASDEVLRALAALIEDPDTGVQWAAVDALGGLGQKAATNEVLRSLLARLDHPNADVRLEATDALGRLGEKAATDEVLSRLLTLFQHSDAGVREQASQLIGHWCWMRLRVVRNQPSRYWTIKKV